jgi:16S rRNA (guanine966-N2)-methyltransferase
MRIIAGEWRGRTIQAPRGLQVRPTTDRVREAWMSSLGSRITGARVLDLFAGSGALGLESLSRGAREVVFVEKERVPLQALESNVRALGAGGRCRIMRDDAFHFLEAVEGVEFDLALADPPYDMGYAAQLLTSSASNPFARELWVEHRTGETLPSLSGLRSRRYGDTTLTIWEISQ